ncbi:MAG: arylamine N-acetyltransferase [Acidimicrobiales bacterium]
MSDLHLAHRRTIPFENLSIHLGEPTDLNAFGTESYRGSMTFSWPPRWGGANIG